MSINSFARYFPKGLVERVRKVFFLNPDKPYYLTRSSVHGREYRYPSPGSQPAPNVPASEEGDRDRTFDISYYKRDTMRQKRDVLVFSHDPAPQVAGAKQLAIEQSKEANPGSEIPDVAAYDQTGLRTSFSTSVAATEASLATYQPNHLPVPRWVADDAVVEEKLRMEAEHGVPTGPGVMRPVEFPEQRYETMW